MKLLSTFVSHLTTLKSSPLSTLSSGFTHHNPSLHIHSTLLIHLVPLQHLTRTHGETFLLFLHCLPSQPQHHKDPPHAFTLPHSHISSYRVVSPGKPSLTILHLVHSRHLVFSFLPHCPPATMLLSILIQYISLPLLVVSLYHSAAHVIPPVLSPQPLFLPYHTSTCSSS